MSPVATLLVKKFEVDDTNDATTTDVFVPLVAGAGKGTLALSLGITDKALENVILKTDIFLFFILIRKYSI
jgi:hypothetical protein